MTQSQDDGHFDPIQLIASLRDDMPSPDVERRLQLRMRQHWQANVEQPQPIRRWLQWLPNTPGRIVAACGVAADYALGSRDARPRWNATGLVALPSDEGRAHHGVREALAASAQNDSWLAQTESERIHVYSAA